MSIARPARARRLVVREVEDGLVVCDAAGGEHHLNPSASVVFALCDGTHTTDAVVRLLHAALDLDRPPHHAVRSCLTQLRTVGLVV